MGMTYTSTCYSYTSIPTFPQHVIGEMDTLGLLTDSIHFNMHALQYGGYNHSADAVLY